MAECEQFSKWRLVRVSQCNSEMDFGAMQRLKIGPNSIGRNMRADIITESVYASRMHCVLFVTKNNDIILTDVSFNGTFVNGHHVKQTSHVLKANDEISIGCYMVDPETTDNIFIFNLTEIGKSTNMEDIKVKEEPMDCDFKKSLIKEENIKVKKEPVDCDFKKFLIKEGVSPSQNGNGNSNGNGNGTDDIDEDDEMHYSQQTILNIKKEASQVYDSELALDEGEEVIVSTANQSFIDLCDDDDDEDNVEDDNNNFDCWNKRLSQNQDKEVQPREVQIIESSPEKATTPPPKTLVEPERKKPDENKVEKLKENVPELRTKLLEKAPSMPVKRKRLVSKSEVDKARKLRASEINNQRKAIETSPKTPRRSNSRDRPCTLKQANEQAETIENEDKVSVSYPRTPIRRISHAKTATRDVPMPNGNAKNVLQSSLKLKQLTALNTKESARKRVRFQDNDKLVQIISFEPKAFEDKEVLVNVKTIPKIFQFPELHRIVLDVTSWDPQWWYDKNESPAVSVESSVILPLCDKYDSCDQLERTFTPLLKHELWSSILAEHNTRQITMPTKILQKKLDKRGDSYIFQCRADVVNYNQRVSHGDLMIVASPRLKFFAYVIDFRFSFINRTRILHFCLQTAKTSKTDDVKEDETYTTQPIANIRTELKLFNAIYHVRNSDMCQYILNPLLVENEVDSPVPETFRYNGFDPLNKQQLKVLQTVYAKCLDQRPSISLIEGPPGTGKSRFITNLILQLIYGAEVKRELKILVCAASNAAVDIIARKLLKIRRMLLDTDKQKKARYIKLVRYGVAESMHPEVRNKSLHIQAQELTKSSDESMSQMTKQIRELSEKIKVIVGSPPRVLNNVKADKVEEYRKRIDQFNRSLKEMMTKKEYREKEMMSAIEIMDTANIVCATLTSSINLKQYAQEFDICIVDEASQCIEPWSMVPLLYGIKSLILVGDAQQLPAVVLSPIARKNNMERSLFTRLQDIYETIDNKSNVYSFNNQYRMHPIICHWPNIYFYSDRLQTSEAAVDASFKMNPYGVYCLDFSQSNNDHIHYHNLDEVNFVIELLKMMVEYASPKDYSYGIITPYSQQRKKLQEQLARTDELKTFQLPVNTVDSYQGQEKDVIIMSIARTVGAGFLSNPQRLNVALTRAKKCLVLCGNFKAIKEIRVWKSLLDDAKSRHLLHTIPQNYKKNDILKNLLKEDVYNKLPSG